jgi:hypothetical protein
MEDVAGGTDEEKTERAKVLHDEWVAILFVQAADPRCFGALIADLIFFYSRGNDEKEKPRTK